MNWATKNIIYCWNTFPPALENGALLFSISQSALQIIWPCWSDTKTWRNTYHGWAQVSWKLMGKWEHWYKTLQHSRLESTHLKHKATATKSCMNLELEVHWCIHVIESTEKIQSQSTPWLGLLSSTYQGLKTEGSLFSGVIPFTSVSMTDTMSGIWSKTSRHIFKQQQKQQQEHPEKTAHCQEIKQSTGSVWVMIQIWKRSHKGFIIMWLIW